MYYNRNTVCFMQKGGKMLNKKMLGMVSLVGVLCSGQYGCSREPSPYETEEQRLSQLSNLEKIIKTQSTDEALKKIHEEQQKIIQQRQKRLQDDRDFSLGFAIPVFGGLIFLVTQGLWEKRKEKKGSNRKVVTPSTSRECRC